jgi:hypothetical protein
MKKKDLLKLLEELRTLRSNYYSKMGKIYSLLSEKDLGDFELNDGSIAVVTIRNEYLYSDKFKLRVSKLYKNERAKKDLESKKIMYVKFYKPDDN